MLRLRNRLRTRGAVHDACFSARFRCGRGRVVGRPALPSRRVAAPGPPAVRAGHRRRSARPRRARRGLGGAAGPCHPATASAGPTVNPDGRPASSDPPQGCRPAGERLRLDRVAGPGRRSSGSALPPGSWSRPPPPSSTTSRMRRPAAFASGGLGRWVSLLPDLRDPVHGQVASAFEQEARQQGLRRDGRGRRDATSRASGSR